MKAEDFDLYGIANVMAETLADEPTFSHDDEEAGIQSLMIAVVLLCNKVHTLEQKANES